MDERFVNSVVCGDSKSVLKELPDNSVDLVFTSPPYNFDKNYESYKDNVSFEEYFSLICSVFDECHRILKDDGRLAFNIQPLWRENVPTHHVLSNYLLNKGMTWKSEIIWEKNTYNCPYTCWGSFKSPSAPYLKYTWEYVEVFYKKSNVHYGDSKNIDITEDEFKEWTTAKWTIAPEHRMKLFGHPAMFPEELAKRVIKLFTFKGDFVVDPFNGVGTTCVVCKRLGRKYLGVDISEEYCKKATERVNNTPVFVNLFNEQEEK